MTTNAPRLRMSVRVLVYREDDAWLAHCLEMDIVAEAKSPESAVADLVELCNFQIKVALEDGDLKSIFRPAPSEYWKMFFMSNGKKVSGKRLSPRLASLPIISIETRELELV